MSKKDLIPLIALRTEFGYQLKLEEAPGNRYARQTIPDTELVRQAHYRLSMESLEEDIKPLNPVLSSDMYLSEDELRALWLALGMWAQAKGYKD